MSLEMFSLVRNELLQMDLKLRSRSPIMRDLDPIGMLRLPPLELTIRPGAILLGTRLFNFVRDRAVCLAGMVQLVHLATHVHGTVRNGGRGSEDDSFSMPILLGDYFYSRFFALAADARLTRLLRPLSETVCLINESAIREGRSNTTHDVVELVHDQIAVLFAGGMAMGSELGGANPVEREAARILGLKLGMGYGLMNRGMSNLAAGYCEEALAELRKLPEGKARRALQEVVEYVFHRPNHRLAVTVER